jgi:hypothetical protein
MNNPGNAVIARAAANAPQDKGKRYALRGRNLRPDESSLWNYSSSPTRRPYVDAHQRPRDRDWINGRQPVLRLIFPASIK